MKSNKDILTLTDSALDRVRALIEKSDGDVIGLRVGVKTAGCSGMKYNVEYAKDIKKFVSSIESIIINTLKTFNIEGISLTKHHGVFVKKIERSSCNFQFL